MGRHGRSWSAPTSARASRILELGKFIYELPGIAQLSRTIISNVGLRYGIAAQKALPSGLRAVATHADKITPNDLGWFVRKVLVGIRRPSTRT